MPRPRTTKALAAETLVSADDAVLIARESGTVQLGGEVYPIVKDVTRVRAAHPIAKAAPHLFKPLDVHYDIERATAAPGELRGA